MYQANDLSRSLVALDQDSTLIAVIEMSRSSWLVGGLVPGVGREPLKQLSPDEAALLRLLERWRAEAERAGRRITRVAVAYEAGRDGFWLARWLSARGVEAYVIHASSVAVARSHRRAKTDRLDVRLLKRAFLGWLRGEPDHCSMAAVPSLAEEDARRPHRERACLVRERTRIVNRMKASLARLGIRGVNPALRKARRQLDELRTPEGVPLPANTRAELDRELDRLALLDEQIAAIEADRRARLEAAQEPAGPAAEQPSAQAVVGLLARIHGLGLETAELLVHEVLSRELRDRRALARYGGLTGAPDESGQRCREQGLARAGNLRVRHAMIQLAWRFLRFQPDSELARWYRARTQAVPDRHKTLRKKLIVALARKLLIALWRIATTGQIPDGLVLRPAA